MAWLYLAIAICAEVIATTALKYAEGFTRLGPSILVVAGYGIAFFSFPKSFKSSRSPLRMPSGRVQASR